MTSILNSLLIFHFFLIIVVFVSVNSHNCFENDEITFLPGLKNSQPTFKHYSGYLQVSSSRFLHYWFVESQSTPASDPLVLWLNGGPGCSSLDGLFNENGPYLANDKGGLDYNPNSWNKIANVLYLESPVGVGFSYDTNNNNQKLNDDQTANENFVALQEFYKTFPQFEKNELFLAGESYGGVYVPMLTVRVLSKSNFNLKGILIGNGLITDKNSAFQLYFAYHHDLIGQNLWNELNKACCPQNRVGTELCFFNEPNYFNKGKCEDLFEPNPLLWITRKQNLNVYNIYKACDDSTPEVKRTKMPCVNSTAVYIYLNDPKVRKAIHVDDTFPKWVTCSDNEFFHYLMSNASHIRAIFESIFPLQKIRFLIYNGDVDLVVPAMANEWFLNSFNLKIVDERRTWFYKELDGSQQIGGFTTSWINNVTFATIRGGGHQAPLDCSLQSFQMFQKFVSNKPL